MFKAASDRLRVRSVAIHNGLENGLERILKGWLFIALLACSARVAAAPAGVIHTGAPSLIGYMLLTIAPVASIVLGLRWFDGGDQRPASGLLPSLVGRWRKVAPGEACAHPLYGTSGIMVSLLVGMLMNVPVRAAEYLAAMPPIPRAAPEWANILQLAMTFDVVLFTSLYAIAFAAALRRSPVFPTLLVAIWAADVATQLGIANVVTRSTHLPADVAAALHQLLEGNVTKVMISVCLWLPYLLLSTRVNVTYRHRLPA